jgi:hypothetical protein
MCTAVGWYLPAYFKEQLAGIESAVGWVHLYPWSECLELLVTKQASGFVQQSIIWGYSRCMVSLPCGVLHCWMVVCAAGDF